MKSHFSFTLILFFYTTLHAGLCTNSTKNDKHHRTSNTTDIQPNLLLKDRVQQTGNRQAYTTDTPSLNPQEVALTQEMLNQVEQSFNAPPGALLANVQGVEIRQEDLICLQESGWLNDTIINAYISMINNRSEEQENHLLPKVYAFNTYFFVNLSQKGYKGVKKWTKNSDIFSYDRVLVPIHLGNHWSLAVIDFRKKAIKYYDSLGRADKDCLNRLLNYLVAEMADKKQGQLNRDEWSLTCLKEIPKQQNTNDCGVFVCKFADYVARDALINFTQNDIPYFRKRIAIEILNGKLM